MYDQSYLILHQMYNELNFLYMNIITELSLTSLRIIFNLYIFDPEPPAIPMICSSFNIKPP